MFFWISSPEAFASIPWSFLTRPDTKSPRHGLVLENFVSVPWSFLIRPDTKSHRQGPTAGSNTLIFGISTQKNPK
jgi:hypothetical protein